MTPILTDGNDENGETAPEASEMLSKAPKQLPKAFPLYDHSSESLSELESRTDGLILQIQSHNQTDVFEFPIIFII